MTLDILQSGLRDPALGLEALELSAAQLAQFERYFALLVEWNARFNLTAITDAAGVQTRHYLDSLVLASPRLRADPPDTRLDLNRARLIDIGAGAGFPGLPLKIAFPGLRLTLVESVGKKTIFLKAVVDELGLTDVIVLNARAEDYARRPAASPKIRHRYRDGRWLRCRCWPNIVYRFARSAGCASRPRRPISATNWWWAARQHTNWAGAERSATPVYSLPGDEAERRLIVFDKTAPTPPQFPRPTAQIKA